MSSNTKDEGEIRNTIVKTDLSKYGRLITRPALYQHEMPACIWFLIKTKQKRGRVVAFRDQSKEVIFMNARKLGYMKDQALRNITHEDTKKIVKTQRRLRVCGGFFSEVLR